MPQVWSQESAPIIEIGALRPRVHHAERRDMHDIVRQAKSTTTPLASRDVNRLERGNVVRHEWDDVWTNACLTVDALCEARAVNDQGRGLPSDQVISEPRADDRG